MSTPTQVDELREATREARAALKDLKVAMKEFRELTGPEVTRQVEERVSHVVEDALMQIGKETQKTVRLAYDKVMREWDKLTDLLLVKDKRTGEIAMEQLVQAVVDRAKNPYAGVEAFADTRTRRRRMTTETICPDCRGVGGGVGCPVCATCHGDGYLGGDQEEDE